jgi:membrane protease YdiL (CAAX protease family)
MMQEEAIAQRRYYALMLVGIILPFLLYPFLSLIFISKTQSLTFHFTFSRVLIWATVALMYLYARFAEVQKFLLWDERKYDTITYLTFLVILFLFCFAAEIVSGIPRLLGLHEDNSVANRAAAAIKPYPWLLIFTCITAGFTEEIIFRGYMLSRLSLFFKNRHLPVIISAVLFSAIHMGYKTISELIFSLLIGLIFGYHYQKYRNISVLIASHFLIDFVALSLYRVHK